MAGYLAVTNWSKYQHYKNRRPPWVKFYVELLAPDNKLNALPIPTRYLFDRMLLLAAEYDNRVPNDPRLLANLLRMPPATVTRALAELLQGHWLSQTQTKRGASRGASNVATRLGRQRQSKRTETEKPPTPTRSKTTPPENGTVEEIDYEPEHPENPVPDFANLLKAMP